MLTREEYTRAQERAAQSIKRAGIRITPAEEEAIQVADFGLSDLAREGAQILTFFATDRVSAKVIALFPEQTLPEHWHPSVGDDPGKEETIRVVDGTVYLNIPGEETVDRGRIPQGKEAYYTVRHESVLRPGDQITLAPGVKHWLRAGSDGAVMYSFSTCVRDILDLFTDPGVVRTTKIVD
ncbi:MAG: D-lyxose/D-mannose family sugar isomerase [Bacteroidota bacterium]